MKMLTLRYFKYHPLEREQTVADMSEVDLELKQIGHICGPKKGRRCSQKLELGLHWAKNRQPVSTYGGLSNLSSDRIFARHFEFLLGKFGLASVRISKQNTDI